MCRYNHILRSQRRVLSFSQDISHFFTPRGENFPFPVMKRQMRKLTMRRIFFLLKIPSAGAHLLRITASRKKSNSHPHLRSPPYRRRNSSHHSSSSKSKKYTYSLSVDSHICTYSRLRFTKEDKQSSHRRCKLCRKR
jgi:hypothetical protein